MWHDFFKILIKEIRENVQITKRIIKKMNHDEIDEKNWKDKRDEW